jgi:hypothetical protein
LSPSASNRITVIASPGEYNFSADFTLDTQYIDLVSLDGNPSVIFNGVGGVDVSANDVFVKGINSTVFSIGDNLGLLRVENCIGGSNSFTSNLDLSGTFIDCVGATGSFVSSSGDVSGTFIDCAGGESSFNTAASGTFTNCVAGDFSFGNSGSASGTFTNCIAGESSFGGDGGFASGTFTDCTSGQLSFGAFGTASGNFRNCIGGTGCFGANDVLSTVSGIFDNCVAGSDSFGATGSSQGKIYFCRLTNGTFPGTTGSGLIRASVDGNNVFYASLP